jgi:hypothetical protein
MKDLTGIKFGKLLALRLDSMTRTSHTTITKWWCRCECGNELAVRRNGLVSGNSKTCGCSRRDKPPNYRHGMSGSGTIISWKSMIQRCTNHKHPAFRNYGARGITVCERWLLFENFLADMGHRPDGFTLERKNNNLGYSPDNCKWATRAEQNANTRTNINLTHGGETHNISEWSRKLGMPMTTLHSRVAAGWDTMEVLKTERKINQYDP